MKIESEKLKKIIKEEVLSHFSTLLEFASEEEENVVDSNEDGKDKEKAQKKSKKVKSEPVTNQAEPQELESPEQDLEADADGQGIGDRISGLTVLSMTVEPKPKTGKTELVLQFKQDPDPLRIIIMPTGDVMFAHKGKMVKDLGGKRV